MMSKMKVERTFGAITASVVAERTEMDKVKVSRATTGLLARGLLEQGPDPADGRARRLRLTVEGAAVHAAIVKLARELAGQLEEGLAPAELTALQGALERLAGHARRLEEAEPPGTPPAPPEP